VNFLENATMSRNAFRIAVCSVAALGFPGAIWAQPPKPNPPPNPPANPPAYQPANQPANQPAKSTVKTLPMPVPPGKMLPAPSKVTPGTGGTGGETPKPPGPRPPGETHIYNKDELLKEFARIDTNGDGRISPEEFRAAKGSDAQFRLLDTNGDGSITRGEVESMKAANSTQNSISRQV
jgi:hypothetical protein